MHLKAHLCLLAYLLGVSCAKSLYSDTEIVDHHRVSENIKQKEEEPIEEVQQLPRQEMALARERAIQVIMEKMLMALGRDVRNHGVPDNKTYPTVSSPLNLTTDPCPDIYMKCSSENFLPSCHPPKDANAELWNQRLNLFFDLPHNLLASDSLLNATLRIYKNSTLPMRHSRRLEVELFVYKKSLTKQYDINYEFDSRSVANGYIGWISFDVTDLIRRKNFREQHGFLIKVKEFVGAYWNAPSLMVPMECFEDNKTVVPIPFGVITDQPEQKYPSLSITTGVKDPYYYPGMDSDHGFYNHEMEDPDVIYHEYEPDRHTPSRNDHREIIDENEQDGIKENSLKREKEFDYHIDYDQDYNEDYAPAYDQDKNNWFDEGKQSEEIKYSQKKHNRRRKGKQRDQRKKMSSDDPKAHHEDLPVDQDYFDMQYDVQEDRNNAEYSHSKNSNVRRMYNSKKFKKPVENQVYDSDVSAEVMDIASPTAKTAFDILSPTKSWHSRSIKTSEEFTGNHRSSKRKEKNRRRHHNHHQSEHRESHRPNHSRSHSRTHSHNEPEIRRHNRSNRHETENLQIDS